MPEVNGIYFSLHGAEIVDQPIIILIHGAGGVYLNWPAEFRRIKGYKVCAVDLPGHGRSNGTALQSVEAYVDNLEKFLDALEIFHFIPVGHALGGAIALSLALRNPKRVKALALISSSAYFGNVDDIVELLSSKSTRGLAIKLIERMIISKKTSELVRNISLELIEQTRQGVLYGDWLACKKFDRKDKLGDIEIPTWLAVGSNDQFTPQAYSKYIFERIPNSEMEVIPGGGHMLMMEEPELLSRKLQNFLGRIDSER
ncbi:MAG: alpha/beta hydrolase [Anaerolineaceae bacterium]|nr:alpha/beta hydrolase [Anaerolineaceae bacterium]